MFCQYFLKVTKSIRFIWNCREFCYIRTIIWPSFVEGQQSRASRYSIEYTTLIHACIRMRIYKKVNPRITARATQTNEQLKNTNMILDFLLPSYSADISVAL